MIYIPSFINIRSGIQVILTLLSHQFERLQCWYYCWEEFIKYVIEVASGGMIYICTKFHKDRFTRSKVVRGIVMQTHTHTPRKQRHLLRVFSYFLIWKTGQKEQKLCLKLVCRYLCMCKPVIGRHSYQFPLSNDCSYALGRNTLGSTS
jgi:hypothetical protein